MDVWVCGGVVLNGKIKFFIWFWLKIDWSWMGGGDGKWCWLELRS